MLADAGPIDAVWHLGDVVGYGPQPDGVVERLIARGAVGVAGNHDRAAAGGDEIDWFNPDARAAMEWTRRRISSGTVAWLRALPERRTEREIELVHGSPRDPIWEYILTPSDAKANLAEVTTRVGLFGHTHLPIQWTSAGGRVPGSEPGRSWTASFAGTARALRVGSSSTSTPPAPAGTGSTTTSPPSGPRCGRSACPPGSPTGSPMDCDAGRARVAVMTVRA